MGIRHGNFEFKKKKIVDLRHSIKFIEALSYSIIHLEKKCENFASFDTKRLSCCTGKGYY